MPESYKLRSTLNLDAFISSGNVRNNIYIINLVEKYLEQH